MSLLDANVILRHITRDNPDQAARARQLFLQLEAGALSPTTTEGVLVEVVQVLSSRMLYTFPRADIHAHLTDLISPRGVKLAHERTYLRA